MKGSHNNFSIKSMNLVNRLENIYKVKESINQGTQINETMQESSPSPDELELAKPLLYTISDDPFNTWRKQGNITCKNSLRNNLDNANEIQSTIRMNSP